jgi:hypothetical protein
VEVVVAIGMLLLLAAQAAGGLVDLRSGVAMSHRRPRPKEIMALLVVFILGQPPFNLVGAVEEGEALVVAEARV